MGTQTGVAAMMPGEGWLCLGLLAAVLWLFQKAKRLFWAFSLLVLPGTFCHETCHYLSGLVLNGRPVSFSVWPRREENQILLGTVMMANLTWYNAFFIGMAPLALLPGAWGLFRWILGQRLPAGLALVLLIFLVANLAYGSVPSGQDFRIAARSPVGWGLLALALAWGWTRFQPWTPAPRPARAGILAELGRARQEAERTLAGALPELVKARREAELILARGARRARALRERLRAEWRRRRAEAAHG